MDIIKVFKEKGLEATEVNIKELAKEYDLYIIQTTRGGYLTMENPDIKKKENEKFVKINSAYTDGLQPIKDIFLAVGYIVSWSRIERK